MNNIHIPSAIKHVAEIFRQHGYSLYVVGGAIRDMLRGVKPKDWDLATDASPDQVIRLFRRVIPTGIKHGTVTVMFEGLQLETTTLRTDTVYSDGRHPDKVVFTADIETDLARRDFTVNAIAMQLPSGMIIDPYGGVADIKAKCLRCVGNPEKRFAEDGLRPLRAARFVAQLEFDLENKTEMMINKFIEKTAMVAAERIGEEIIKILRAREPSRGLRAMERTGLLYRLLPELQNCRGVDQKGYHSYDVLDHSFLACDHTPNDKIQLRLAALFHDIGKPKVIQQNIDGNPTFHRHEEVSAQLTRNIMQRFRYPAVLVDIVCHLIASHMFYYEPTWTDAAIRRFIVRVKPEHLDEIYALRRADSFALCGMEVSNADLTALSSRVDRILAAKQALALKDLSINGHDLLSIGVENGPKIGVILHKLMETVLDDPSMNQHEKLLEEALRLSKQY